MPIFLESFVEGGQENHHLISKEKGLYYVTVTFGKRDSTNTGTKILIKLGKKELLKKFLYNTYLDAKDAAETEFETCEFHYMCIIINGKGVLTATATDSTVIEENINTNVDIFDDMADNN
mgnify:CR=1 FL=1